MTSAHVLFVQAGLHEIGDIVVLILPKVSLGNWLHCWIGSLDIWQYMKDSQRQRSLFSLPGRYLDFLPELLPDQTFLPLCQCKRFRKGNTSLHTWKYSNTYSGWDIIFQRLWKCFPPFNPSLDWSSLNIPPQITFAHHTSIPDPEMTRLLDTHWGLFTTPGETTGL